MIAKAKAISHGRQAINYVLRDGKLGTMLASNLIESISPDEILKEFEMMQRYNTRCRNKFLRFEIGIAPQDFVCNGQAHLSAQFFGDFCGSVADKIGLINCTVNIYSICYQMDMQIVSVFMSGCKPLIVSQSH